jgi:CDGSH-type Zn-finger protein
VPRRRAGQSAGVSHSLPAEPDPADDSGHQPAVEAARTGPEPGGQGATITPYRDGPLIVRGSFRLLDQDGGEIDPGRETIALCRCGKSGIKPFCDGSHKRAGFSAPSAPSRPRPVQTIRQLLDPEDDTVG